MKIIYWAVIVVILGGATIVITAIEIAKYHCFNQVVTQVPSWCLGIL